MEELAKVQADSAELEQYVSLISVQNKGLKRHFRELEAPVPKVKRKAVEKEEDDTKTTVPLRINSIKGINKKKRLAILDSAKESKATSDPNVIGFEVSLKQLQNRF